jgi:isopenicillin-N epimerase
MDRDDYTSGSIDDDDHWRQWRDEWEIRTDTTYLNHGSFGPTPRAVRGCQLDWQRRMTSQPMDFFARQFEPEWLESRTLLARFVGTATDNLAYVENSTAGMNVVAATVPLHADDEVLLTDHEYGAVQRIWRRACQTAGAAEPVTARLPRQFESAEQVVESIFSAATGRTRLLVVSHITSPTAIILPVRKICEEARRRGIAVCIDGPHAPAQVPVALDELACDFYTASLHKWVSAPLGSGFVYVAPQWQERVRAPILSWGRVAPTKPTAWWEEFVWTGTRDASAYLAVPAAIELLERVGLAKFRARTHFLARYARHRLVELTGLPPHLPDSDEWYASMSSVPLPPGNARALQNELWQRHGIEVPVVEHNGERSIRVSCHLYNRRRDVDLLVEALGGLLRAES